MLVKPKSMNKGTHLKLESLRRTIPRKQLHLPRLLSKKVRHLKYLCKYLCKKGTLLQESSS